MIELNVLFAFEGLLKYKLSKLRTEEMEHVMFQKGEVNCVITSDV